MGKIEKKCLYGRVHGCPRKEAEVLKECAIQTESEKKEGGAKQSFLLKFLV